MHTGGPWHSLSATSASGVPLVKEPSIQVTLGSPSVLCHLQAGGS